MKKIFLKTFGCQMNLRDSEVVLGLFKDAGFKVTDNPKEAGVVIFNTCSVRQHAEERVLSEVGLFKDKKYPLGRAPIIGIIGCMAQNYKDKIFDKSSEIDFAVGPADIAKIPEIVANLLKSRGIFERKIWETDGSIRPEEVYHSNFHNDKKHAYVVISEGCSNFCSYCVVPFVRGKLHHRRHEDIIKEIREAVDSGISLITLLGQNVNSYQDGDVDFIKLIHLVNSTKGLKEVTFITSHPRDTTPDLFRAMADLEKVKKDLHLPVQSGSDKILKLMNRGYSRKYYLDLAKNYRKIVNGGFTTDIIVGFPGESEEDFKETYSLLKEVKFNAAYIFKYSPRPHTQAVNLADDVIKEEKERRHKIILELQRGISKRNAKKRN
jgi:tRNA-2-methylthio-N6-dimethylallyladenosine synthase